MPERKIENVNDAERNWIASEIERARGLIKEFCPHMPSEKITLELLDQVFLRYYEQEGKRDPAKSNDVINALGLAFGMLLTDGLSMEWVAVTDEYGCDIAVIGLRGSADMLVFPTAFVAKRWERCEFGFFVDSYCKIADEKRRFEQEWSYKK